MDEVQRLARLDADRAGRGRDCWVFGDTEDPRRAPPSSSPDDPFTRIEVLEALGAIRIDIPYVQPALGPGKRPVRHCNLVGIPPAGTPKTPRPSRRAGRPCGST